MHRRSRNRADTHRCAAAAAEAPAEEVLATDKDLGSPEAETILFGDYRLSDKQLAAFDKFYRTMRQCGIAFAVVAISSVVLSYIKAKEELVQQPLLAVLGLQVGTVAYWLDSLLMAALLLLGARSLHKILREKVDNHLPLVFQAFSRMGLIFQQFAVAALVVGLVQGLQAVKTWPGIINVTSIAFFGVAGLRFAAFLWLLWRQKGRNSTMPGMIASTDKRTPEGKRAGWVQRLSMRLLLGHLAAYNALRPGKDGTPREQPAEGEKEYELTEAEEQMLRVCIDSMHTAGLALLLHGIMAFLSAVASFATQDYSSAAMTGYNSFNKIVTCLLLFRASHQFDAAVSTEGCDMTHVVKGIGMDNGLSKLFHQLSTLSWAVAASQAIQIMVPAIEKSTVAQLLHSTQVVPRVAGLLVQLQNILTAAVV